MSPALTVSSGRTQVRKRFAAIKSTLTRTLRRDKRPRVAAQHDADALRCPATNMLPDASSPATRAPLPPAPRRASVSALPAEILSSIFEWGISPSGDPTNPPAPDFSLLVLRICSRWRNVALATPRLWSVIRLRPRTSLAFLEFSLTHSKIAPLDVNITAPSSEMVLQLELDSFQRAVSLLVHHLPRWEHLSFSTDSLDALESLLTPLLDASVPSLRSLTLLKPDDAKFDLRAILPPSFLAGPPDSKTPSTPRLTRIDLRCIGLAWASPVLLGKTGARLTALELAYLTGPTLPPLSYGAFHALLSAHPQLEHLVLRCTGPNMPSAPHPSYPPTATAVPGDRPPAPYLPPILLPALHALKISTVTRGAYVTRLLTLLRTPALHTLALSEMDFDGWDGFVESLRAWSADTEAGADTGADISAGRRPAEAKYPAVRELVLTNSCIVSDVDDVFFRSFPHLEHITLFCVEADPFMRVLQQEAFPPPRAEGQGEPPAAGVEQAPAQRHQQQGKGTRQMDVARQEARDVTERGGPQRECLWPDLKTMSLRCMYNEKALRATVEARAVIGRPIKKLRLEESLAARLGESTLRWLGERTHVEEFVYKGC